MNANVLYTPRGVALSQSIKYLFIALGLAFVSGVVSLVRIRGLFLSSWGA